MTDQENPMTTTPAAPAQAEDRPEHIGEPEPAFKCETCEAISDSEGDAPLYECENDGVFNGEEGNRCPECNKFAARIGQTCAECGEGPVEEILAFHCAICDELVEDGDQEDHLHEDDEDEDEAAEPGQAGKPRKPRKSPYPVPIIVPVPAREVAAGALLAVDWPQDSYGAEKAASGKGEPYQYSQVDEVAEHDGRVYLRRSERTASWPIADAPADGTFDVVTGWDRPTGAYEITAADLRLHHVVFTAPGEDWTARRGFTEIRHDLTTGQVIATSRYRKNDPGVTYAAETPLVVADTDPASMLGKPGWRVEWDRGFPRPLAQGPEGVIPNPDYDPALDKAMEARGYVTNRKVYVRDTGDNPYLAYAGKQPKMAEEFMAFLREHGYTPTALVEEAKGR